MHVIKRTLLTIIVRYEIVGAIESVMHNSVLCKLYAPSLYMLLVEHILYTTEGLAVGVGFGAIGKSSSATLESARYSCSRAPLFNSVYMCQLCVIYCIAGNIGGQKFGRLVPILADLNWQYGTVWSLLYTCMCNREILVDFGCRHEPPNCQIFRLYGI